MNSHINGELSTKPFHWYDFTGTINKSYQWKINLSLTIGLSSKITKWRSPFISSSYPKQVWDDLKQGLVFPVNKNESFKIHSVLKNFWGASTLHFDHFPTKYNGLYITNNGPKSFRSSFNPCFRLVSSCLPPSPHSPFLEEAYQSGQRATNKLVAGFKGRAVGEAPSRPASIRLDRTGSDRDFQSESRRELLIVLMEGDNEPISSKRKFINFLPRTDFISGWWLSTA